MIKIKVKQSIKHEELWKKICKIVKPGWGYFDLSGSQKEALPCIEEGARQYISAIVTSATQYAKNKDKRDPTLAWGIAVRIDIDKSAEGCLQNCDLDGIDLVKININVSMQNLQKIISNAAKLGNHLQTLGIIPIFSIQLQQLNLQLAQRALGQLSYYANDRNLFLQAIIIQIDFIPSGGDAQAIKNLAILRRTIPSLVGSVVIRFNSKDQKGREVFQMSFTSNMKVLWVLGFAFNQVVQTNVIERVAYHCSGID